jgi:glycosyltransferase involved in cell wall biosynthesis
MRILHVCPAYYPSLGGAETHIRELSERLVRKGHDVTVFTTFNWGLMGFKKTEHLEKFEIVNGVKVRRFETWDGVRNFLRLAWRLPGSYRSLRYLLGPDRLQVLAEDPLHPQLLIEALRFRADVTTVVNWASSLAGEVCMAKKVKQFPLVALPLFHTEELWSQSGLFQKMLNRCDAIVVNTHHEKEFVTRLTCNQNAVQVVGVGVDPKHFSGGDGLSIRNRYGLGEAPIIGYMGRIAPNKGVIDLIKAMKLVSQWNPETRLVLAGYRLSPETRGDRDIRAALEGLSPEERCRIIFISDFEETEKASIVEAFDVFAMPSVGESFGIAYLEAWMCRKPVVGARIGSTQCVIEDGVDGMLVDVGDIQGLAKSLITLLGNSNLRTKLGQVGYEKTVSQYSWDVITEKMANLYFRVARN